MSRWSPETRQAFMQRQVQQCSARATCISVHCTHALCTAREAARRIGLADKEALLAGQYLGWGGGSEQ